MSWEDQLWFEDYPEAMAILAEVTPNDGSLPYADDPDATCEGYRASALDPYRDDEWPTIHTGNGGEK